MAKRKTKNLFKNPGGKWCIDVTMKGRRVIRVIGDDKRAAEEALAVIRTDLLRGKLQIGPQKASIFFRDFAKKFLDTYAAKKRSYARDLGAYKCHLGPHFDELPLSDIKLERVEEYIAVRRGELSRRKKEPSGATINRELALLRTMLNKAVDWDYIPANPVRWRRVTKLREDGRERYMTLDERARLLQAIDESPAHLRAFVVLAINTGMRSGEILGLKWANINLNDGIITLERTMRKSGKVLRTPINQAAREVLEALPRVSEYVLCDPATGTRIKSVIRSWKTACRRAEIVGLRIHDLRHTFATMLNIKGFDIPTISTLLGHSSVLMTSKYITPISDSMKRAVDSLVDEPEEKRKQNESRVDEKLSEGGKTSYIQ